MNTLGRLLRVSLFGESHGEGVGVLVDGLPPGIAVDRVRLQRDLDRRRPGRSALVSQRHEPDLAHILSGVHREQTTGAPLAIWVRNQDAQAKPYLDAARTPRPGHADWVNHVWSQGAADLRGGGHSSGRLTAGLVAAGSLVEPLLAAQGIRTAAHIQQIGKIAGKPGQATVAAMQRVRDRAVPSAHKDLVPRWTALLERTRRAGDSVGGIVEFRAEGLPVGLGDPFMDSLESALSHGLFAVPAVKGVSFGSGFAAAAMTGSQHNDAFAARKGRVRPATNHAGGILGGRSTGAPLWGHLAIKPTSSIFQPQATVDLRTGRNTTLKLSGRHDPCIALRAVPVARAVLNLVLTDALLLGRAQGTLPA